MWRVMVCVACLYGTSCGTDDDELVRLVQRTLRRLSLTAAPEKVERQVDSSFMGSDLRERYTLRNTVACLRAGFLYASIAPPPVSCAWKLSCLPGSQPHTPTPPDHVFGLRALMRFHPTTGTNHRSGMYEEAAIILRRLYGEDASLCLEARGTEQLASMMFAAGKTEQAEGERKQYCTAVFALRPQISVAVETVQLLRIPPMCLCTDLCVPSAINVYRGELVVG